MMTESKAVSRERAKILKYLRQEMHQATEFESWHVERCLEQAIRWIKGMPKRAKGGKAKLRRLSLPVIKVKGAQP